jgi:hypothetical protein
MLVMLIPPHLRGHKDMDRPTPIFDHADLGTREPDDPELMGYEPGHPWYYLLGGRPLRADEIEPDFEWELPHDVRLERLKAPAKREKRLMELCEEYEKSLQKDIERYEEVISPGYEMSKFDRSMGYGLETSIYLCRNHILSRKAWLAAINRELGKYQPSVSTPSKIALRQGWQRQGWNSSPTPQVKEQLRLF